MTHAEREAEDQAAGHDQHQRIGGGQPGSGGGGAEGRAGTGHGRDGLRMSG